MNETPIKNGARMQMTDQGAVSLDELRSNAVVLEVRRTVLELCTSKDAIIAAVSGGRDSVALATSLATLSDAGHIAAVTIGHVHHHRRPEADDEAALVEETAARLRLPFAIRHLDEDPHATPAQLRASRYEALEAIASASQAPMIATAHQAQDQLETVIAAIVRGTGPRGLVGMPAIRPLSDNVSLVRPMLEVDRSAAGELCSLAGLTWCDDPTNTDPETLRGLLRRDVLPVLESLRPGVASRLASGTAVRAAASLALDEAVVRPQEMDDDAVQWSRHSLADVGKGLCQASLMATARSMVGGADGLSSASILSATTAILDTRQHRRVFELGCGVVAIVDAMRVRMQILASTQPIESRPPK